MLKVEGVIPAIVTPFDEQEALNEAMLRKMIQRMLDAGVDGLFCLGTNGEFYALTEEEKVRIIHIAVEECAGRVPVYAGAGSPSTHETIRLIGKFEAAGASAISLITPYFVACSQAELIRYFEEAAASTQLPIVMYNMPARTGNALGPDAIAKLANIDNIVGIKDSSGSFDLILNYLEKAPSEFSVMAGNDGLILSTLMAGGRGTVSAMANILPDIVVKIYHSWREGRYEEAEQAQRVLRIARSALKLGTQPAALKAFLHEIGLPVGRARRPVSELNETERGQLKDIVQRYKQAISS